MKMNATLTPDCKFVDLVYDDDAKNHLLQLAAVVRSSAEERLTQKILPQYSPYLLSKVTEGAKVLERLGGNPSATIQIGSDKMDAAFVAASVGCIYLAGRRLPISLFAGVFVDLARITPTSIPFLILPPAAEIFDRSQIEEEIWNVYEEIRTWNRPGVPHLFILPAHQLLTALCQTSSKMESLATLVNYLAASTGIFRTAMNLLAMAEMEAPPDHGLGIKAQRSGK